MAAICPDVHPPLPHNRYKGADKAEQENKNIVEDPLENKVELSGRNKDLPHSGRITKTSILCRGDYRQIIIHSASADASADMPENRLIKLKIILKHSRML